jgi:hypothetical protein
MISRALAGSRLAIIPDRGHGQEDPVGLNALVGIPRLIKR